jgi:hypothetical protein
MTTKHWIRLPDGYAFATVEQLCHTRNEVTTVGCTLRRQFSKELTSKRSSNFLKELLPNTEASFAQAPSRIVTFRYPEQFLGDIER